MSKSKYNLDESIEQLLKLSRKEFEKKKRIYSLKNEEVLTEDKMDLHVKIYLRNKEETMKRRTLRMKSLRNAEENKKELSSDFDEKYKQKEQSIFNKKWVKLSKQLKLNRINFFLKQQKEEHKWDTSKYNEVKELLMFNFELDQLRKTVVYNENDGKIINCKLLEQKE